MLVLTRFDECLGCTPGILKRGTSPESSIFECYTIERPWLDNKTNISCIPNGSYKLAVTYSNRFKKNLIQVLDVPGRDGIRFHPGNSVEDSTGCILPCQELRLIPFKVFGMRSTPACTLLLELLLTGAEDMLVIL